MRSRSSLVLVVLLGALVAGCPKPAPSSSTLSGRPDGSSPTRPTHVGSWREQWGIPGETDVDYHDEYEVRIEGGRPIVLSLNPDRPEKIERVTIEGDRFDLVIHTSFDVHYQLTLDASGNTMNGTATTPEKTVPIRWDRITP